MAKDPEPNKYVLFDNGNYKKTEKHPDYKGKANVTCPHCQKGSIHELGGWDRKSDFGKFISGTVSEPYKKGEQVEKRVYDKAQAPLGIDDDLPPF
jgi:hypothetical protein